MPRPVSIKDIAREIGVSHPTVSRALKGSPLVHPDTAAAIRQKAQEMGYQVSAAARTLVTQKSWTIGVVVASIADPFFGDVVTGIEEVATQNSYTVILANTPIDATREISVVRSLREQRVDGIIVTASRVGEPYIAISSEMHIPIVLLNNEHGGHFVHSISIDNIGGARKATEYLLQLGHRRIAYLGNRLGFRTDEERFRGYCDALESYGVDIDKGLVAYGDGLPEGALGPAATLLGRQNAPTAVFGFNDMTCLGVLHAAARLGRKVPESLSLVGFDDVFFSRFLQPPLTTVNQPRRAMGVQAMDLLLAILSGETAPKNLRVEGDLIVRASAVPPL